jgi:putative aldouronate transport system permease protein
MAPVRWGGSIPGLGTGAECPRAYPIGGALVADKVLGPQLTLGTRLTRFLSSCRKMRFYLLLVLPCVLWYLLFHYYPIYGIVIAFKDYRFADGILGSKWIGFLHFQRAFRSAQFWEVMRNTIIISLLKLAFGFPAPIIFALLLNEVMHTMYKKVVQTISYLPYFMSWVVLAGLFKQFLSPSTGVVNQIMVALGMEPIYFLTDPRWFRTIVVSTSVYQGLGWGSIVYLAVISGIDAEMYESAVLDGAGRLRQVISITLPSMANIISILLIFSVSGLLTAGFDQIFNLYNPLVYSVGDILDTYVFRVGLVNMSYSFSTAINLFRNVVALALLLFANFVAKRFGEYGVW